MMTADELYAKGYSLEYSIWGVSVYRTIDGSHGASDSSVQQVALWNASQPVGTEQTIIKGWELAQTDLVKRRLDGTRPEAE
jgi:hypothetical protein